MWARGWLAPKWLMSRTGGGNGERTGCPMLLYQKFASPNTSPELGPTDSRAIPWEFGMGKYRRPAMLLPEPFACLLGGFFPTWLYEDLD